MPLTTCPFCGQTISDSASKCVHCGNAIIHCKNCGKTIRDEATLCEECTRSATVREQGAQCPDSAVDKETQNDKSVETDYIKEFFNASPKTKELYDKFEKIKKIHKIISWFIAEVLIAAFAVALIVKSKDTQQTNTFIVNYFLSLFIFLPFSTFWFVRFLFNNVPDYVISIRCCDWIKHTGIDGRAFVAKRASQYYAASDSAGFDLLYNFAAAVTFASNEQEKRTEKLYFKVHCIFGVGLYVWLACICPFIMAAMFDATAISQYVITMAVGFGVLALGNLLTYFLIWKPLASRVTFMYSYKEVNE